MEVALGRPARELLKLGKATMRAPEDMLISGGGGEGR